MNPLGFGYGIQRLIQNKKKPPFENRKTPRHESAAGPDKTAAMAAGKSVKLVVTHPDPNHWPGQGWRFLLVAAPGT